MKETTHSGSGIIQQNLQPHKMAVPTAVDPYGFLEHSVESALRTYSNVHRGRGQFSMITTYLYEQARSQVLDYLEFDPSKYKIIFTSPLRADLITGQLPNKDVYILCSRDFGLPLGVVALAVKKKALKKNISIHTGGGTARLMSPDWVIWLKPPERFEAGTPAVINVIAFARALNLVRKYGNKIFQIPQHVNTSIQELLYEDEFKHLTGKDLLNAVKSNFTGFDVKVPVEGGEQTFVNLDNAATTPAFKPVIQSVFKSLKQPASMHKEMINEVKLICGRFLGAPADRYEILFTSNTTESINLAAENQMFSEDKETYPVLLISYMEHSSNDLPWRKLSQSDIIRLPVDTEGFLDFSAMDRLMAEYNLYKRHGKKRIKFVALSGASNVLAIFNDLKKISDIVHKYNARLLIDAAQLVAHHKINMEECGIDYLAFSGHKAYAPFGCGLLVCKKNLLRFNKAAKQLIRNSGEENIAGIVALGKSLVLMQRIGLEVIRDEEQQLTAKALKELAKINGLRLFGLTDPDSAAFKSKGGVLLFILDGMMADRLASELARRGAIGIRSGCHCAHILVKQILGVSPFLERFQRLIVTLIPKLELPGIARASIGLETTEKDIDRLVETLKDIAKYKKPTTRSKTEFKYRMKDFAKQAADNVFKDF